MAVQKTESKAWNLFKIWLGFQGTCPVGVFLDFQMGPLRLVVNRFSSEGLKND